MSEKAPYFKWFPKDCDSDENVRAMDDREFGFYVRLLNHSWLNEGVPADMKRLAIIMGRTTSYLAKVWPAISPCFFEKDGRLFNKMQENLREILQNLSEKKSGAASARWDKHKKTQERGDAPASVVQCYPDPDPDAEEEPPKPPAPLALDVVPRNGHRKRGYDRTSEEIRKALGPEREKWWDSFWKIYPCREGMKAGMDAFERRVTSRELAVEIYHGAERYAQQAASDPSMKLKYAQGWINGERWKDENRIPPKNSNGNGKVAGSSVMQRPKHETTEEELIEAHLQQASSINDVEGREYSIKWLSEKGIQPYAKAN